MYFNRTKQKSMDKRITVSAFAYSLIILVFVTTGLKAGSITERFNFAKNEIAFKKIGEFDLPVMRDWLYTAEIGKPMIPYLSSQVLVPPTAEVTEVKVLSFKKVAIEGEYYIHPSQPPVPISYKGEIPFVPPDEATYNSIQEYPARLVDFVPTGSKSGYRISGIEVYPLRYVPKERKLFLYTELVLEIVYEEGRVAPQSITESQKRLFGKEVGSLIINKNDLRRFEPPTKLIDQGGEIDYLVITSSALASHFQSLADWKIKKGWNTKIRTTTWINTNYSGRDLQERIRSYIRICFADSGLKFVLLAGDSSVIPKRGVYARVATTPPTIDSFIPCDLYFADLQWSWDGNQNNVFGDTWTIGGRRDTVDLYYDLYIGRASVETPAEVTNFINKLFTYEKNPNTAYLKRILLPAALLWSGYNHIQSQDSIANLTPVGWTDRVIDQGTNTGLRWQVRDSLNVGFGFCHLVAHGNDIGTWIVSGTPQYYYTDPPTQTNYDKLTIINSIACYPGNFEYSDCLAEEMMKAPGSAIAVIMNSRYGWGQPPSLGPSERLDIRFYHYFFSSDTTFRIGANHARSKDFYRNLAFTQQVWRWCYYELNLFGCPEMPMWRDVPLTMTLTFDDTINTGSQTFTVTVTDPSDAPVQNALVCLWKGNEVYARGYTNPSGIVNLTINPTTAGQMLVTASAFNHLPKEDTCEVVQPGDVGVTSIVYPIGLVDSTATLTPRAAVKNFSASPATFDVIFKILPPANYVDTVTVSNLSPNAVDTVNFALWTVGPRGNYTTQCTIVLASDTNPINDTLSGSFQLVVKDVGVVAIFAPWGPTDSAATLIPRCSVHNYENTLVDSFPVVFRITGAVSWSDTQKVYNLSANSGRTVLFDPWTIGPRGNYITKCSTALVGDVNPTNDTLSGSFSIIVHDVGVTQILAPTGVVALNSSIPPQAVVRNFGTESETFDVSFTVLTVPPSSWTQSWTLNPGQQDTVSFAPSWLATPVGTHQVRCSTLLANDAVATNNLKVDSVTVSDADVGVVEVSPLGNVDSTATIIPQATVMNYGTSPATFSVILRIIGPANYADTFLVNNLPPNFGQIISFDPWTVGPRGNYQVRCTTALAFDTSAVNDTMSGFFSIIVHDVATTEIIAPKGVVALNQTVTAQAVVRNLGTQAESFNVSMVVLTPMPTTWTIPINNLGAGETDTVDFGQWVATPLGTHQVRCSTDLANDSVSNNNLRIDSVTVSDANVGVVAIFSPSGNIDSTATIIPRVGVMNYGSNPATFPVILRIIGPANYADTFSVNNLPPAVGQIISFDPWAVGPRGTYQVRCTTALAFDTSAVDDTMSGFFSIIVHDVGVTQILAPTGVVVLNSSITPQAVVRNFGTETDTFDVSLTVLTVPPSSWTQTGIVLNSGEVDTISFSPNWTANPIGTFQVRCSTALTKDSVFANNRQIDSVRVVGFDVGVNAIVAPVGTIDSAATPTVVPQASITNYSTVSVIFPAIFRITQGAYIWADTQNINLGAGQTLTVNFDPWTINATGVYSTRCTTGLVGDINLANNHTDSTFRVVAPGGDVGVTALILNPAGPNVDSGTTVQISARVKNFGTEVSTFQVKTKIGNFYLDSLLTPLTLNPGESASVSFANWVAVQRGYHIVRCSTELTGDINHSNDRQTRNISVQVRDVRTYSILAPTGNIDSTASPITPQARVENVGNVLVDSFPVTFTISGPVTWTNTQMVRNLPAGQQRTVDFAAWTIGPVGAYTTSCSTAYINDMNPANDRRTSQFWIQRVDISVDSIISPLGTVDSNSVVPVQAWVSNQGTSNKTFKAIFRIGTFYTDTVTLTLNSLTDSLVTFDTWYVRQPEGVYPLQCTTVIANDANPTNNQDTGSVRVRVKDVAVDSIIYPSSVVPPGIMNPIARVINNGSDSIDFYVYCRIRSASGTVYFDSAYVPLLAPDSSYDATFPAWDAVAGTYIARCSLAIADDMVRANDTLSIIFNVATRDVGVKRIVYPGRRTLIGPIQPRVVVKNYSSTVESFWTWFSITDSASGGMVYFDSVFCTDLRPWMERILDFSVWTANLGNYRLISYTSLVGDDSTANDTVIAYCRVDSIILPKWAQKANMPLGPRGRSVKRGGCITFGGNNLLFALKGAGTNEFYAYNVVSDTWITLETIPHALNKKKKVKGGAAICYDGNNTIFALKGSNTLEFWAYSIPYNTWVPLPDVPAVEKRVKSGSGLAFVPGLTGGLVYCLKGSKTFEFYAYSITANSWIFLRNAPAGYRGKPFDKGSCMTYDPSTNQIYVLKGYENEFFAYNIVADSWAIKASLPIYGLAGQKRSKDGAALVADGSGLIYAFKGNNSQEFWVYHINGDWWEQIDPIPIGPNNRKVNQGGSLAYSPTVGKIYALKGNRTRELWTYNPNALFVAGNEVGEKTTSSTMEIETRPLDLINFKVTPNPNKGNFMLKYNVDEVRPLTIKLYNALGERVFEQTKRLENKSGMITIATEKLATGIYIMRIEFDGLRYSEKVLLQK